MQKVSSKRNIHGADPCFDFRFGEPYIVVWLSTKKMGSD